MAAARVAAAALAAPAAADARPARITSANATSSANSSSKSTSADHDVAVSPSASVFPPLIAARRSRVNTSNICVFLARRSISRVRLVGAAASNASWSSQSPPAATASRGGSRSPSLVTYRRYGPNTAEKNLRNAAAMAASSWRTVRICASSALCNARVGRVGNASRSSGKYVYSPSSRLRWNTSSVGSARTAGRRDVGSPTRKGMGAVRYSTKAAGVSGRKMCCHRMGNSEAAAAWTAAERVDKSPPLITTRRSKHSAANSARVA